MKVSEAWLREWINPASLTAQQIADQLTMAGLEVDGLHAASGDFSDVIVAYVVKTQPHPDADKLTVCMINTGSESHVQVVCGAKNVRAGLYVAMALPGSVLPGDIYIKSSLVRGQASSGMLCSAAELGLEDNSEGILELPDNAPVGMNLRAFLELDDLIFDIDLTPNRADCLSVLGLAREVAALNDLNSPVFVCEPVLALSTIIPEIKIVEPAACPQYCTRVLTGIDIHAITPLWMQERLRRSGLRLIHPVVDVMNYVMLEVGQPLHAFDLTTIAGSIQVRYGRENESIILLDGKEIICDPKMLVIADQTQVLALAGLMGGSGSAVQAMTTDILIESAFFTPKIIAAMARHCSLGTDASQRFERGVDPTLQHDALERATALLISVVGGVPGPVVSLQDSQYLPAQRIVSFSPDCFARVSGMQLPETSMQHMLESLNMPVQKDNHNWMVTIPAYRFDISLAVDLVEEILRLYGYDKIEEKAMQGVIQAAPINYLDALTVELQNALCMRGYQETMSYSFVDPGLQAAIYPDISTMDLLNPLSEELSTMRAGLWPGLLASMVHNLHRQQTMLKLFETGVIFEVSLDGVLEHACCAGLITGSKGLLHWGEVDHCFDFFDLKGDLQAIFASLRLSGVHFEPAVHPALHPGKTARVVLNEKPIGWLGVLHPRLTDAVDARAEVMLFEIQLQPLVGAPGPTYQKISKYPQTRRDLSLVVDVSVSSAQIEQVVRGSVPAKFLKSFDVFDVYLGASISPGQKSVAIALTLQHDERTLQDVEINTMIDGILHALRKAFSITLRTE